MSMSRKRMCVLFCGGVLLLAVGGIMIPVVDMLLRDKIKEAVTISNSSEYFEFWSKPPVPAYMQFYMFNVSNPEEVKDGKKPVLVQRGPYTYREDKEKHDIVFNANGTVSYKQKSTYAFERSMSVGDESDFITTGNPTVLAAIQILEGLSQAVRGLVGNALTARGEDLFVTRSVQDLLWGYNDHAVESLMGLYPYVFNSSIVGYFINKNNTDEGTFTVFTGASAVENLGYVNTYNGHKYLPYWTTRWANMINGTDGTISPPFEQGVNKLSVFSPEICRSVDLEYQQKVSTKQDIPLRRFIAAYSQFENASANPANIGFCTPQTSCLPTGLMNLSNCMTVAKYHVSVIASFPHFYMANPDVVHSVIGLKPVAEEHETTVDVEPWTGLVLQAAKRLQINMHLRKLDGFSLTYNVRSLYLPIFWINESFVIDDKHATKLQRNLFTPIDFTGVLEKVFMFVGAALVFLVMVIVCRRHRQDKLTAMPPGPVPTLEFNGTCARRSKRSEKERVPLLTERRESGPPSQPSVTYKRQSLDNTHIAAVSVAPGKEPTYQKALDA